MTRINRNFIRISSRIFDNILSPRYNTAHRCISQQSSSQDQEVQTMSQVRSKVSKMMAVAKGFRPLQADRSHLLHLLPTSQDDLPVRSMQDSFDMAIIPLSHDPDLQDRYSTVEGWARVGRILEEIDLFAVWLSLKHIDNPKQKGSEVTPYTIVTIGVDQIIFSEFRPKVTNDMRISGQVRWTGKTSLEVCVQVETYTQGEWRIFTKSYFIMAARNCLGTAGAIVNKIVPKGAEEEAKFEESLARKKRRAAEASTGLLKSPPTVDEGNIVYNKFFKTIDPRDPSLHKRILPSNSVWMKNTRAGTLVHPHPENRNHHNTVFGGYLMRLATELSWMTAFTHGEGRPNLCHISEINFRTPVSIDSFLRLKSQIVYVEATYVHVVVYCEKHDIVSREWETSNTFHFTYELATRPKDVLPESYLDTLAYLEGRRHFEDWKKAMASSESWRVWS